MIKIHIIALSLTLLLSSCASRQWVYGTTRLSGKSGDRLVSSFEKRLPSTREDLIARIGSEPLSSINKDGETYDVWHFFKLGKLAISDEVITLVSRSKSGKLISISYTEAPYTNKFDLHLYEGYRAPIESSDYPGASMAFRKMLKKRETARSQHIGSKVAFSPDDEYWIHLKPNQYVTKWNPDGTCEYNTIPIKNERYIATHQPPSPTENENPSVWSQLPGIIANAVVTTAINEYLGPDAGSTVDTTPSAGNTGRRRSVSSRREIECPLCHGSGYSISMERAPDFDTGFEAKYRPKCKKCGGRKKVKL